MYNVVMEKDIVYVIGHKCPDTDSVTSAVAYAKLLNMLGHKAKAVMAGKANNETKFSFDYLGLELPDIIDDATGKKLILVDHSEYAHALNGTKEAEIIKIIDHHIPGDIAKERKTDDILIHTGACATLIYEEYCKQGITIDKETAGILLTGIISDTNDLKRIVTDDDKKAYKKLKKIADIKDLEGYCQKMYEAFLSYDGMDDDEIFMNDYKEYARAGRTFALSCVRAKGKKEALDLLERMYKVMTDQYEKLGMDILITKVHDVRNGGMYLKTYKDDALKLLKECLYDDSDSGYIYKEKNLSRKKELVPLIYKELDKAK